MPRFTRVGPDGPACRGRSIASIAAWILALTVLLTCVETARADDPPPAPEAETAEARRDPAFYRGRSTPPPPEEALMWIPRVLFAPIALVTEMILRRPILALLSWAEEERILEAIELLLSPHPNVRWSPALSFEAGVRVLPGFNVEWRKFPFEGNTLRVDFAMGSTEFFAMSVRDEVSVGPVRFGLHGGTSARPERPFFGLGNDSASERFFYAEHRTWLSGFVGLSHGYHVRADLTVGWSLEESAPGISPSVERLLPLEQIPGFGTYELGVASLDLTLDTRAHVEERSGVRFVGQTTVGVDSRDDARVFMTVELDLEAGIEVAYPDRVLVGRIYAMSTLPFGDEPVPFMRLATLGWDKHRGFIRGRYRGEAALMAEVRYHYPIAFNVDAIWLTSVGNVFARDGSDFDVGALTASFGVGLRTRRTGIDPIELTFAVGTRRFDDPAGFGLQSARFFFETRYGL